MNCHEIVNRLDAYIDGVLPAAEAAEVETHVLGCAACSEEAHAIEALVRQLGDLPKELDPGPAAWERIGAATLGLDSQEQNEEVSDAFIAVLSEAVAARLGERSQELLAAYIPGLERLRIGNRNTARLFSCLALAIDMGFYQTQVAGCTMLHLDQLKKALSRVPRAARIGLPAETVVRLRFCEGVVALMEEDFDKAAEDLQVVGHLNDELGDLDLIAAAKWFLARSHIRKGQYDLAETCLTEAGAIARRLRRTELSAVIQARMGWLLFQRGDHEGAIRQFDAAIPVLQMVADHRNLGFIQQCLGRIKKREGKYGAALDHYREAIREFQHHPHSPSQYIEIERADENADQGQTLVNIAFVIYLLSRRYKESDPERERLRKDALDNLKAAESAFRRQNHPVGGARVHLIRAFLHIQGRQLEDAEREIQEAYFIGCEYDNPILLARACVLRCKVENRWEEYDKGSEPGYHAEKALEAAQEAIRYASKTQNQRLRAKAWIWRGLTVLGRHFNRIAEAQNCYQEANRYLQPLGDDNVTDHFKLLGFRLGEALGQATGGSPIPQEPISRTLEEIA